MNIEQTAFLTVMLSVTSLCPYVIFLLNEPDLGFKELIAGADSSSSESDSESKFKIMQVKFANSSVKPYKMSFGFLPYFTSPDLHIVNVFSCGCLNPWNCLVGEDGVHTVGADGSHSRISVLILEVKTITHSKTIEYGLY